jgi:hypothetical protein
MPQIVITNWQRCEPLAWTVKLAFPQYRRKMVYLHRDASDPTTVTLNGLNWDGGSRNEYRIVLGRAFVLGDNHTDPLHNLSEGKNVTVPIDGAIIEGGIFCGKDKLLRVHVNADLYDTLLAACENTQGVDIVERV